MARRHTPWWLYLFAASFLACFAMVIYNDIRGPESVGISAQYLSGAMVLTEVQVGSPAALAGLRTADHIVSIDGQSIRNIVDWMGIRTNFEVATVYRWDVERGPERLGLALALRHRQPFKHWDTSSQQRSLAFRGTQLFLLLLALVIAFNKPHDKVALIGAWFLAALSTFNLTPPIGLTALWRHLPSPIGALLWIAAFSSFLGSPLLFTFFVLFPRRLFSKWWIWVTAWTPIVVVIPPCLTFWYHAVYRPQHVTGIVSESWLAVVVLIAFGYVSAGLLALVVNYRRLEDLNQRRRARVVVAGSTIGILPVTLRATFGLLPALEKAWSSSGFLDYFTVALTPIFPLSFAYAILRHRLFDVRVIIRNGLQYAVARGVLLYLVPAAAATLVLDLLLHKDLTLGVLLSQRGWLYGVVISLAFLVHVKRQSWVGALDRRFFREHYDAQQLLRETIEEIRAAGSLDAVAPRVAARIEAALHPEFVALMVRQPHLTKYHSLATAPAFYTAPNLEADSKVIGIFHTLGKPLPLFLEENSWLSQQLPAEESALLRASRIDLLVPISLIAGGQEALLALGVKRSEEPYSGEDQGLLSAIGAALALLLEKRASPVSQKGFQECPQCGTCYDNETMYCAVEGAKLTWTSMPRLLDCRYQLEKKLGQGGMGKVYKALDIELARHIAVKLIRDDLVANSEIAERFRREAKSAAAFAHPNVVTVHDFGIEGESRAFLVMELLEGETLRSALRKEGRMAANRTLGILRCVCAALEAAHLRQLVHRDLKPENIFLLSSKSVETAKVLDFGLAKFLPQLASSDQETLDYVAPVPAGRAAMRLTTPGFLVGTFSYMSPEQLRGDSAQPGWDLWALSIIAYEMLMGAYPFGESDISERRRLILGGSFTPVSARLADAPQSWQLFFDSALNIDPVRRPGSVPIWLDQLERCLSLQKSHTT